MKARHKQYEVWLGSQLLKINPNLDFIVGWTESRAKQDGYNVCRYEIRIRYV